jgi:glycosyltransferase involved in cell wall biosynthesis
MRLLLLALDSLRIRRKIKKISLTDYESKGILESLNLKVALNGNSKMSVLPVDYKSRLIRPRWLRPYLISNIDAEIFIQQQADPISVGKHIAHVIRLHDVLPLTHPQYFDNLSVQVFSKSIQTMLKRKPFIVMDSVSTSRELENMFDLQGRVFVVPPIIEFKVQPTYRKKKQIILVNTLEPRKRTQFVIDGFLYAKRLEKLDEDWNLVVVGSHGWLQETLVEHLKNKKFGNSVEYYDSPTDSSLAQLYDESSIVISLSAAEGFGLPPLEGMYFGCLPIVSDIPEHRDNLGDKALFVDGVEPTQVALVMKKAAEIVSLDDEKSFSARNNYITNRFGREAAKENWNTVLSKIINIHQNKK